MLQTAYWLNWPKCIFFKKRRAWRFDPSRTIEVCAWKHEQKWENARSLQTVVFQTFTQIVPLKTRCAAFLCTSEWWGPATLGNAPPCLLQLKLTMSPGTVCLFRSWSRCLLSLVSASSINNYLGLNGPWTVTLSGQFNGGPWCTTETRQQQFPDVELRERKSSSLRTAPEQKTNKREIHVYKCCKVLTD